MADKEHQAEMLVEEGLQYYGAGLLDKALAKWQSALNLVPNHHRAREYFNYVNNNRMGLEESFHLSNSAPSEITSSIDDFKIDEKSIPDKSVSRRDTSESLKSEQRSEENQFDFLINESSWEKMDSGKKRESESSYHPPDVSKSSGPQENTQSHLIPKKHIQRPTDDDFTPRVDIDNLRSKIKEPQNGLNHEIALLDSRMSHGSTSNTISRDRKLTPLTLITGEGSRVPLENGFEPLEATPVGITIPEPVRVVNHDYDLSVRDNKIKQDQEEEGQANNPAKVHQESSWVLLPPMAPSVASSQQKPSNFFHETMPGIGESDLTYEPYHPKSIDKDDQISGMLTGAYQFHEQGTYEGSLWLCEQILTLNPKNSEAQKLFDVNQTILISQYERQIGDLNRVPSVLVPQNEIVWHKLDHRAGFTLSRVDGRISFEDLLDISGMPEFETCRILAQLMTQRIIGVL